MTDRTSRRTTLDSGRAFFWAFALFAIFCGAILMLADNSGQQDSGQRKAEGFNSILTELESATSAIEDKNYGKAKTHLRLAKQRLSRRSEQ